MDRDGARSGFDIKLTRAVVDAVEVPVIASGRRRLARASRRRDRRRRRGRRAGGIDLPLRRVHDRRRRKPRCGRPASKSGCDQAMAYLENGPLERRRPRPRRGAGCGQRARADARVDEPCGALGDRCERLRALLVALAAKALEEGRVLRPRAGRARSAARLRQRHRAAGRRPGRRHRLPHRPRAMLLQAAGGRRMEGRRAGPEGPEGDLRTSTNRRIGGERRLVNAAATCARAGRSRGGGGRSSRARARTRSLPTSRRCWPAARTRS